MGDRLTNKQHCVPDLSCGLLWFKFASISLCGGDDVIELDDLLQLWWGRSAVKPSVSFHPRMKGRESKCHFMCCSPAALEKKKENSVN